ncbi:MAG: hypothetical protein MK364_14965, partial [Pirellulales bacterium]|nr:hypothetical protein [Pirellulales bacterium]
DVQRGVPVTEGELSVIPLLNESAPEANYLTFEAAVKRGGILVEELSESGSVPELRVKNSESLPVFVLDGEQLLGAKQNRIVNLSLMVPAKSEMIIPVTCVERGRWSHRHDRSQPSEHVMYAEARASKMAQVTDSMARGTTVQYKRADQGAVWSSIDAKSRRMRSHSSTDAMETVFRDHATRLETFVKRLTPVEHQVGAIFVARGVECGVELFDSVSTWTASMARLVRSWAMDAIDDQRLEQLGRRKRVDLIDRLCSGRWKASPALGLGWDARLHEKGLTAGALLVEEQLVHVASFDRS